MIRYHRSLNHKLCRFRIGGRLFSTPSALYEKSKSLGSGGSMVARLKLKEIDGRAPPGVARLCSSMQSESLSVSLQDTDRRAIRHRRDTASSPWLHK